MGTRTAIEERHIRERLLARDPRVLAELYDQFSPTVFGSALRITADRSAAEDITQSIFIDLWRQPERWDPGRGSLRPWLATIAHHRGVDWLRRDQAIRRRDTQAQARFDPPPDVEEAVESLLTAERVQAALRELPEGQRVAIRLAYLGGRTYRQVAEELSLPEGTVKSRIRAGLSHLAKMLDAELVSASST